MKAAILTVLALVTMAMLAWRRAPAATPSPANVGPSRAATSTRPIVPSPAPGVPPPGPTPRPNAMGRTLSKVALDHRVSVFVKASLEGDADTCHAMKLSLQTSGDQARPAVRARLDRNPGPRERALLEDLLRDLP